jgi:hypothetical protein
MLDASQTDDEEDDLQEALTGLLEPFIEEASSTS